MNFPKIWNSFCQAVRFLTLFPLGKEAREEIDNRAFLISFPLVGLLIGLVLFLFLKLFNSLFPQLILSNLIIIFYLILTRMLHLDGLIDTFDGLLGGQNKESALHIMKDPQAGSFGVVAAVLYFLIFWSSLSYLQTLELLHKGEVGALVAAPCVGRWAMLFVATTSKPARKEGLGNWFLSLQSKENLLWASFLPLVVIVGILKWAGLILFAGAILLAWCLKIWSERKIGGVTGDILGAVLEITQLYILVGATAAFHLSKNIPF